MPETLELPSERTWQERLGGRWAIAIKSYFITVLMAFLAFAQAENLSLKSSIEKFLIVFLGSSLSAAIVSFTVHRTLLSQRRNKVVDSKIVLASYFLTSVVYSITMIIAIGITGLNTTVPPIERILFNGLVATWWGSVLAIFLDYQEEYRTRRKSLIDKAVFTEISLLQQGANTEQMQAAIEKQVYFELEEARQNIQATAELFDWDKAKQLLAKTAEETVRPISRKLLLSEVIQYPKMRFSTVLKNIFSSQQFGTLTIVALDLFGAGPAQVRLFGFRHGIFLIAVVICWVLFISLLSNKLMRKFSGYHLYIFILGIALMEISVPLRAYFREKWDPGSSPLTWKLSQLFLGTLVILLSSSFGAWKRSKIVNDRNFLSTIQESKISAIAQSHEVARFAAETARNLHGAVQTRLVSCAMAIEQASSTGDIARINDAISEAMVVLTTPPRPSTTTTTIGAEVARKVALWEGLCHFEISVENENPNETSTMANLAGRVVEEGIANAIRHGKAKKIVIHLLINDDSSIAIRMSDDGVGPKSGTPGLGSAFLEQISHGVWSLKPLPAGAILYVLIPATD